MILLVIPAHNAQVSLPPLLAAVRVASVEWDQPYRALVVDDGSNDDTADVAQDFATHGNFELLRHPQPLGEGAALKTGLRAALDTAGPADVIVTLDIDNTHSPALVKVMLPLIQSGNDVVISSRFAEGGREVGLSPSQRLISKGAAWLTNQLFPLPNVRDHTSRCRAHRAETLQKLVARYGDDFIQENDFACWLEILLKLAPLEQIRFAQVPLVVRHDLKPDPARESVWRALRRHARVIGRNWRYKKYV